MKKAMILTSLAVLAACGNGMKSDAKERHKKFWNSLAPAQQECVKSEKKKICGDKRDKACKKKAMKACGVGMPGKQTDAGKLADNEQPEREEIDIYEWED